MAADGTPVRIHLKYRKEANDNEAYPTKYKTLARGILHNYDDDDWWNLFVEAYPEHNLKGKRTHYVMHEIRHDGENRVLSEVLGPDSDAKILA